MYIYIHSDYLSLGANNGNQNHYCFCIHEMNVLNYHDNVLYFIHKNITAYFNLIYCLIHRPTISITIQLVGYHILGVAIEEKHSRPHRENQPNKKSESNSRLYEVRSRKHDNMDNIATGDFLLFQIKM